MPHGWRKPPFRRTAHERRPEVAAGAARLTCRERAGADPSAKGNRPNRDSSRTCNNSETPSAGSKRRVVVAFVSVALTALPRTLSRGRGLG